MVPYIYLSRNTVRADITKKYKVQRRALGDVLVEHADTVALTVDIWSDRRMRGFLGVTVHFMEGNELSTALLSCKRFFGE